MGNKRNLLMGNKRNLLTLGVALVVLTAGGVLFWLTSKRLGAVEERLDRAEGVSRTIARQMNEYSRELDLALQRARASREQAEQLAGLEAKAETRAQQAEQEAGAARAETQQARAATQEAREQIDALRRRRQEELDRMREALNRIAPTRRTPLGMVMELASDSFKFDFDKSSLRQENREVLSRVAGVLLASKGYRLAIYGYTDDIGTEEYNMGLSERRAKAVADYLIHAGVPADIISTKGYGKTSPRVQGTSAQARRENRRVEIGIVDTIIGYHGTAAKAEP